MTTLLLLLAASTAHAQPIGIAVSIPDDEHIFLRRYKEANHIAQTADKSLVEADLAARMVKELKTQLKLFDWTVSTAPTLTIWIYSPSGAPWPNDELRFTIRSTNPGDARGATLYQACPGDLACRVKFDDNALLRRKLRDAIREWISVGEGIRSLPVTGKVERKDGGMARFVGKQRIDLGPFAQAVFEIRPAGIATVLFVLCNDFDGSAVGPFVNDAPSLPLVSCKSFNVKPTEPEWKTFYLIGISP